jgi:2-dehydropantoate 2-reductase
MRYVIYGAGAIGATIGARLHMVGRDVTLLARGAHLEHLNRSGLVFSEPEATTTLRIPAFDSPAAAAITADDVVILAMKSNDTPAALDALAAVAPPDLAVVCAQNGVNNERLALRLFSRVYGVLVIVSADHLEPGAVSRFGHPFVGVLDVGRYPSGTDEMTDVLAGDFQAAGFRSEPDPDVMAAKYRKLYFNLGNIVHALVGPGRGDEVIDEARREAESVFDAAGISMIGIEEDKRRRRGLRSVYSTTASRSGGSTWQSLARGTGTVETDYLNGEIVLLGRLHGVATPVNERLCARARESALRRSPPGSLDPAALSSDSSGPGV